MADRMITSSNNITSDQPPMGTRLVDRNMCQFPNFSLDILTDCKTKTDCLVHCACAYRGTCKTVEVKDREKGSHLSFVIVQTQTSCLAKLNYQATVSGFVVAIALSKVSVLQSQSKQLFTVQLSTSHTDSEKKKYSSVL